MCGPAVGFMLGAAQAVMGFAAQSQDAAAQDMAHEENRKNAITAMHSEQRQLQTRYMQEDQANALKKEVSLNEQAQASAEAEVSAAAGGVGGVSVKRLVQDVVRKSAMNRTIMETNWKNTAAQLTEEMKATKTRAEGRINSVPKGQKPSKLALGLNIAAAGVKAVNEATKES